MSSSSASGALAGSRRFWVTVLCFAVANLGIWFAYHKFVAPRRDLLRVESAPAEGSVLAGRPVLVWKFNLDVNRGGPADKAPGAIEPAIAGRWDWRDARTLTFQPDSELPRARKVTFTLSPERIRTAEGFGLGQAHAVTVKTAPLAILGVRQAGIELDERFVLELEFNDKVIPADAAAKLKLSGPDGKPLGFKLHGQGAGQIVRVMTDSVPMPGGREEARKVHVHLDAGLAGTSGPLGMEHGYDATMELDRILAITEARANAGTHGKIEMELHANGSLDLAAAKQVISVEPSVAFNVQSHWSGLRLVGDFEPAKRYAIKIAAAPPGADGRKVPRPDTLSVFVPDRTPAAWFEHTEGYLGASGNRTLLAHAVNVPEVTVSMHRVYDNNLVAWRNANGRYRWRDPSDFARPIATKTIKLAQEKNKIQVLRLALDDILPAECPRDGVYRMQIKAQGARAPRDDDDFDGEISPRMLLDDYYHRPSAAAVFTLSDIGLTAKTARESVTLWAVSLSTARPLGGVRVRVFSNKNQLMGEAITSSDGLARVETLRLIDGEGPAVVLADVPQDRTVPALAAIMPTTGPTTQPIVPLAENAAPPASTPRGLTWLDLRTGQWDFADSDLMGRPYSRQGCEAFVYTDRGVYRPGETVYLRAVVRNPDHSTPAPFPAKWQIRRPDLRDWKNCTTMLDADGAAAWELKLPDDVVTGRWSAQIGLPGGQGQGEKWFGEITFQVEEFMPDRMKVGVKYEAGNRPAAERFSVGKDALNAVVQADYLFGRPCAGLRAQFNARLDPQPFTPKNYSGWTFGDTASLIDLPGTSAMGAVLAKKGNRSQDSAECQLDDKGAGKWELDLEEMIRPKTAEKPQEDAEEEQDVEETAATTRPTTQPAIQYRGPWRLHVSASISEMGGRAVTATNDIPVDALPWYIGIQRATSVQPGLPAMFPIQLVTPQGEPARRPAKLDVAIFRESWNNTLTYREGRYHYQTSRVLDPITKGIKSSVIVARDGTGSIAITVPSNGRYVLRVLDPKSGAMTSLSFYASDGTPWEDNVSRENPEWLEVVLMAAEEVAAPTPAPTTAPSTAPTTGPTPQAATRPATRPVIAAGGSPRFQIGDSARVLVRSPFAGRLLLAIETDEVITTRVIDMPASQVTVPIDIPDACRPNAYVTATVIRAIQPNVKWRTHRAFGAARLSIDPADRKLDVNIVTAGEVRPKSSLEVKVEVTDHRGLPVRNAAVTLAAVDEGILQLTNFPTPDPLAFFFGRRALGVKSLDLYSQLMPEVPKPDKQVGGDGSVAARHRNPVSAKRVKPVAMVSPVLHTDENGLATMRFDVPEFAGKLRVMSVSYRDWAFGSGAGEVRVRSPLLFQSSFPRFAAPGDRFSVPVMLFNNGTGGGEVTVSAELVRDSGAMPLAFADSPEGRVEAKVAMAAGAQHAMQFHFQALHAIGVAKVRLVARMGSEVAEETVELGIRPASPMISRGGFATAEVGSPLKLDVPADMLAGTQSLDIRVTPWPTLQLPEGLEYLERYPYGCAEQTISTCFPLAFLSDLGPSIAPGVFEKNRVAAKVQAGVLRLIGMQTADGGIGMWQGASESWPWTSVYAAHFITEAESAGHAIPDDFRKRLMTYVRRLLDKVGDEGDLLEAQAYAAYVLATAGKPERAIMARLVELANAKGSAALPQFASHRSQAKLFLAAAWLAAGRKDLAMQLLPQTPPLPRDKRQLSGNVGSPVRDRAILISTLLQVNPDHPSLPTLVQQLADAGRKGHWASTQDCAFSVMAMARHLRQMKDEKAYAAAELLCGSDRLAASEAGPILAFSAGTHGLAPTTRPATAPSGQFVVNLIGDKGAKGHVSWIQSGVPLKPPADADSGLKIRRRYLNDKDAAIESSTVRSGDVVRVEISIESATALDNLVIEDLLPAGMEIENPRLATAAKDHRRTDDASDAAKLDLSRLDMRDDRLIIVVNVQPGTVTYTYLARATNPGTFVIPPVRGECMYDIGTSSISGGGATLIVRK